MVTDLDAPLVKFSADPRDWWTLRDAVRGVQIFGGIGSGKSSGSGRTLALSFLKAGFGGLVLTGKVDETTRWVGEYAALARRSGDVVVFGPDSGLRFNPLAYEMGRSGPGGGETANVVALFSTLMRLGGRAGSGGGGEASDPFWEMAMQRLVRSAVDLLRLARQEVTIEGIARVVGGVPHGPGHLENFRRLAASDGHEDREVLYGWGEDSFAVKCLS